MKKEIDISKKEKRKETSQIVEHLFRHESGKVIAYLVSKFGTQQIELIEDAVQEALYKAMQVWSFKGIPDQPTAWILKVSGNKLIDRFRKNQKNTFVDNLTENSDSVKAMNASFDEFEIDQEFNDDLLKMIFTCCHPTLKTESQIILVLKILCGFSTSEIARSLLKKEEAIAKAYTRGKSKLRSSNIKLEVPQKQVLKGRLGVVLKVIYLLFNEGYSASTEEDLIRKDLCFEAIRLATLIVENQLFESFEACALLSLMYYHAARFEARVSKDGDLITLDKQDRNKWDRTMIEKGTRFLTRSANGLNISEYHIQASIAASHCTAEDYASVNWKNILSLYDLMVKFYPSPVVSLNRVVAFSKVYGANRALKEIDQLAHEKSLQHYYLFYAIKAELLVETGENGKAKKTLEKAISLTKNKVEKLHLTKKMNAL